MQRPGAIAVALTFSVCLSGGTAHAARPNLILFLIDDQNDEQIACFGGKTWTPNLDRMAAEGMRFTQAHVSSAVCTPSRYTFLTGRYAGTSHSKRYDEDCGGPDRQGFPNFNVALEHDRMNVARVLSDAGYVTGFTGKFHLDSHLDWPEFYGEDGLRPIPKDLPAGPETQALFVHNEAVMQRYLQAVGFDWARHVYPENLEKPYNKHNPEWTVEAALQFIDENRDRPFYLHCCTTLLHGGQGSWRESMDHPRISGVGELQELPRVMTPRQELLETLARNGFDPDRPIAGEAWIDDAVGAILRKLDELKLSENTLVIFTPDHGRDGKSSLFSHNGVRVPMIARWPAGIPAGTACDQLVQNIDWAPTAFDLAGAVVPEGYRIDGRSLRPLFATGTAENWRDHLYFEMGHARAVTSKDWKYIAVRYPAEQVQAIQRASGERLARQMSYIGREGIGTRGASHPGFWDEDQLYDLREDPEELRNLAGDPRFAERLSAMRTLLMADLQSIGRPFGEFIPGGNATPGGQLAAQIAEVRRLNPPPTPAGDEPLNDRKKARLIRRGKLPMATGPAAP